MTERDIALQLAMRQLGFLNYGEYYNILAKCSDTTKKSAEFKEWECFDGTRNSLVDLLEEKQNIRICSSYCCDFNNNMSCTNPTFNTEHNIPCFSDIN